MNPEREVRHRLGHPYWKPLTEDVKYTATFTTSPIENYFGQMSQTNLTCTPEYQVQGLGCPGFPKYEDCRLGTAPCSGGYLLMNVKLQELTTVVAIEEEPMEPLRLIGVFGGFFNYVGLLFGMAFVPVIKPMHRFVMQGRGARFTEMANDRLGTVEQTVRDVAHSQVELLRRKEHGSSSDPTNTEDQPRAFGEFVAERGTETSDGSSLGQVV